MYRFFECSYFVLKMLVCNFRGTFDLHLNNSSAMKCNTPSPVQWTPINPNLMLSHQRKLSFIPCTFLPKGINFKLKLFNCLQLEPFLVRFTLHQHCKGYMKTYQLHWRRKISGAPLCIISDTRVKLPTFRKLAG